MKRVLAIIGFITLLLATGGGLWFYMKLQEGLELDNTSRAFVETEIPKLAQQKWYGPYMKPLAHPAFMEAVSMEDWQRISTYYWQKLGMLQQMEPCNGQAKLDYTPNGNSITAEYQCSAQFANAPAIITIGLMQHQEQWKIIKINVESEAFLP